MTVSHVPPFVANDTSAANRITAGWLNAMATAVDDLIAADALNAKLAITQLWTKAQRGSPVALTSDGNSIAIDLALANNFTHTMTEGTTLAAPSNPVAGQSGVIVFTQHATVPKALLFNSFWKFSGGGTPDLTATVNAVDTLSYYVESATRATCSLLTDVK